SAGDGHRYRQDLHRVSDHLAVVEVEAEETHPLSRRPQYSGRPDQEQRLQALRPGDDQDRQAPDREVLRDLPVAVPGSNWLRGRKERLQAVLPELLRPGGDRRMPPWQRIGRA